MKRICKDCGCEFELTQKEISFYNSKGLSLPKRCQACRDFKKKPVNSSGANDMPYSNAGGNKPGNSGNIPKIIGAVLAVFLFGAGVFIGTGLTRGEDGAETASVVRESVPQQETTVTEEPVSVAELPSAAESEAETEIAAEASEEEEAAAEIRSEEDRSAESESVEQQDVGQTKEPEEEPAAKVYRFRSKKLLTQHFEKHGAEFPYATKEEYEAGACAVINSPEALHKTEAEDGDDVYYLEATNEFVIVSTDGYIRTYFKPSAGIDYYNRQ